MGTGGKAARSETGRGRGGAAGKGLPAADRSLVDPGQTGTGRVGVTARPGILLPSRTHPVGVCEPRPPPGPQLTGLPCPSPGFLQQGSGRGPQAWPPLPAHPSPVAPAVRPGHLVRGCRARTSPIWPRISSHVGLASGSPACQQPMSVSPLCPAGFPPQPGTRLRGEASAGGGAGERPTGRKTDGDRAGREAASLSHPPAPCPWGSPALPTAPGRLLGPRSPQGSWRPALSAWPGKAQQCCVLGSWDTKRHPVLTLG